MSTEIQTNIASLISTRNSLLLASLNELNLPEISSSPFLKIGAKFYIFISELASHTRNIKQSPKLSIMLIEDEQDTKNAFARKRLSYECSAIVIDRQDLNWNSILDQFEQRHGKTVSVLKQLQDFHLFELNPTSGQYIEGFGKTYRLTGKNLDQIALQTKA